MSENNVRYLNRIRKEFDLINKMDDFINCLKINNYEKIKEQDNYIILGKENIKLKFEPIEKIIIYEGKGETMFEGMEYVRDLHNIVDNFILQELQ